MQFSVDVDQLWKVKQEVGLQGNRGCVPFNRAGGNYKNQWVDLLKMLPTQQVGKNFGKALDKREKLR